MRYTKCPTCGNDAYSISGNFDRAGILVDGKSAAYTKELREISTELINANELIKTKIENLNSDQLFFLYRLKLHQEIIIEAEEAAIKSLQLDAMQKDFENGLRKMFGDL